MFTDASKTTTLTQTRAPVLILGPAYSGKSELALQTLSPDRPAAVLGTAQPPTCDEPTFAARLKELRALRPAPWDSIECGIDLAAALDDCAQRYPQVLIDSVSQWLAGLIVGSGDPAHENQASRGDAIAERINELAHVCAKHPKTRIVFVTAETGAGPAPSRPLERLYRQQVGLANQKLARLAETVIAIHAGIPMLLKG